MNWVWLAFILSFILIFAVLEGHAIKANKTTLSRFVWNATKAWPPLPFVLGNFTGGLAVHFWWPWCPV